MYYPLGLTGHFFDIDIKGDLFALPPASLDEAFAVMSLTPWCFYRFTTKHHEAALRYALEKDAHPNAYIFGTRERITKVIMEWARDVARADWLNRFCAYEEAMDVDSDGFVPTWPLSNVFYAPQQEAHDAR